MASSDQGVNMCEATAWHRFFLNNNLYVFDVIHGALSAAILYWPDYFLKKRDGIIKILYTKNKKNCDIESSDDHMSSPPPPPISFQEAYEWYEFFSNNHLAVFDVLHGALSVAVLFWSDDFLKRRDDIAQFVNAKKPFQYKNKKNASASGSDSSDHHSTIISHPVADDHMPSSPPPAPPSMSPPPTTLGRKDTSKHSRLEEAAAAKTEETTPKFDTLKPRQCINVPKGALTTSKKITTQKVGLPRRPITKDKVERLLEDSSKYHHHLDLSADTTNKRNPGGHVASTRSGYSQAKASKGTSGFKKDNSAATAKMKLQTTFDLHDEATLERKLEASKRKLYDGYKNAEAAKKRIVLIDATYIPNQQRNNVPVAVNCTTRF